ncbi:MAG: hypothetical protein ACPGXK_03875 [Phycisphaerae bacterium]
MHHNHVRIGHRAIIGVVTATVIGLTVGVVSGAESESRDIAASRLVPLPKSAVTTIHRYQPGAGEVSPLTNGGELEGIRVYANTTGTFLLPPGADRLIGDDLILQAAGGCDVTGYRLGVSGGGDGTGDNPFTVEFALYDSCPGEGGQPIPGTEGEMTFDDDGQHLIEVDLSQSPIFTSPSLWVGVRFSRAGAGWIVGTMAEIGFTEDLYHFPTIPCDAKITPLYAGFQTEVFCGGDVSEQFFAYLNTGSGQSAAQGASVTVLDDLTLAVDSCELIGMQVGLVGNAGPYSAEIGLWSDCAPNSVIEGSTFTFEGLGNGTLEFAAASFDPPITLPTSTVWMAVTPDRSSTGPVATGESLLGFSEDIFAIFDQPGNPDSCGLFFFNGTPYAAFNVSIFCAGSPPTGACCDIPASPDGPLCEVTPVFACENGRWIEGATCDDAAFDPPCGTAACCLPENACQDLSSADCEKAGGIWNPFSFCDEVADSCPFFSCMSGTGDCCGDRSLETGCALESCCDTVCREDSWCCQVEWDGFCADATSRLCNSLCPFGGINWIDPPQDVVDAGQPFAPDQPDVPQGIRDVLVSGPSGVGQGCCWEVCQADADAPLEANPLAPVQPEEGQAFSVVLSRPIESGAATRLTYAISGSNSVMTAHPGNVNGDAFADGTDLQALIDCLSDAGNCPFGAYSCDLNRDGACGPEDLLRLHDLLAGGGPYEPAMGTARPTADTCPQ